MLYQQRLHMKIRPFKLERYFAKYEFSVPYQLSCSDCQPLLLSELLELSTPDTKKLWDNLAFGYTDAQGHPVLRETIAQLYKTVKKEDVLVTAPQEGVFIAMQALLEKGDHVICPFPQYQSLSEIAVSLGCQVSWWKPHKKDTWVFDVDELLALIQKNTKLIVLNFPHNPTGALIPASGLAAIIKKAREYGTYIFSDEMYRFLEYDAADRLPNVCDEYERGISLFGMSKTFSLPGLRIGWLAAKDKQFLQACAVYKDYTTICSSAPSEILAIMGLEARDRIIAHNLATIAKNKAELVSFCNKNKHIFTWLSPQAGSICFIEVKTKMPVQQLCNDLIAKKGVMVLPGTVYDYEGNYIRIGLGKKVFAEPLALFDEYIKEQSL